MRSTSGTTRVTKEGGKWTTTKTTNDNNFTTKGDGVWTTTTTPKGNNFIIIQNFLYSVSLTVNPIRGIIFEVISY